MERVNLSFWCLDAWVRYWHGCILGQRVDMYDLVVRQHLGNSSYRDAKSELVKHFTV